MLTKCQEFRENAAALSLLYAGSRRATLAKQAIFKNFRMSGAQQKRSQRNTSGISYFFQDYKSYDYIAML